MSEWIKCSERVPDDNLGIFEFLVFETLNNRVHHDYWVCQDQFSGQFRPFWNHYGKYVTHWMPLPEKPEGL